MKKKIFISYSNQDKDKIKILETVINANDNFDPLIIAANREPLKPLVKKVIDGINKSELVIPILTEKSIHTQWINQEIGYATGVNKRIIPIIEDTIIDVLKGFIHKQIDLPYTFKKQNSPGATNKSFKSCLIMLMNDLSNEYQENFSKNLPKQSKSQFDESLAELDKLNEELEFNKKRKIYLESFEGQKAAKNEFTKLITDLKVKVEILKSKNIWLGTEEDLNKNTVIYKTNNFSFSIVWTALYTGGDYASILEVRFWRGIVTSSRDGYYRPSEKPTLISHNEYKLDMDKSNNLLWVDSNKKNSVTTDNIVQTCIDWIIDKIKNEKLRS
jgi:hypothetical protein